MMKEKITFLLIAVWFCAGMLTACGENKSSDLLSPAETTFVIETTADGGTIEMDSEGNQLTKDNEGNILAVQDKSGNSIDVQTYITEHYQTIDSDSANDNSSQNGSKGYSGGKSSNGNSNLSADDDDNISDSDIEDDIPQIEVTLPDEEKLQELPSL